MAAYSTHAPSLSAYGINILNDAANATKVAKHKTFFDKHHDVETIQFTIFTAIALYNVLELILLIFTTFRRFRGLYFTSMLAATLGLFLYSLGTMIEYFKFASKLSGLIVRSIGWPAMITGQSLVLYSRLGVMFMGEYPRVLKTMKWTIIVDAVVNHTATIILTFGNVYALPHHAWSRAFNVQHKFGRTCFTIQECILSALYIWRAVTFLRNSVILNSKKRMVLVMWQLIIINLIIAGLDIYVLVEEFISVHPVRQMVKAVVYGIKLKLEFAVLSQLVDITTESRSNFGSYKQNQHLQSGAEDGAVRQERGTAAHSPSSENDVETAGEEPGTAGWPANGRYVEDPLTFHTVEEQ